mmetsp:Transcript_2562/g.5835  ORF Transcript_2562/g.5835 Transcript_2562/m.5835 type:complete len:211 (-) Transcript_2562:382-1014(-)|eukprot:CAMPEP_0114534838 /NCGR_PEP_ID=MMETSP0109-20121206/28062_1 /TAXON_ID=29199 /ORGANISM="Chlorarachnion reptans, Strain CCCM449" /LENGTH=210 /DNA_ID=CAMNT_0001718295 /DNA_START=97 /DNA_END=729 /DNA_ORIENTATION=-
MQSTGSKQNRVLDTILKYQNESRVTYADALEEMKQGKKKKHWIWYVFPCWSKVRRTSLPECELPDLSCAVRYLEHTTLRVRLEEVTEVATTSLEKLMDNLKKGEEIESEKKCAKLRKKCLVHMFGSIDAVKFVETCTLFLIATHRLFLKNDDEKNNITQLWLKLAKTFQAGLTVACGGKLHAKTMGLLSKELPVYKGISFASQIVFKKPS